jgi:hypothetical protein
MLPGMLAFRGMPGAAFGGASTDTVFGETSWKAAFWAETRLGVKASANRRKLRIIDVPLG